MNFDYWEEHIKATLVTAAHLAVPVEYGFTLAATPPSRAIAPGGVATFTIGVQPSGAFTATVDLVAASPSPSLTLDLHPGAIDPPGQAILTLTDAHTATLVPGLRYTVPITASGNGITQTTSVSLLVEGGGVYGFTLDAAPPSRAIAPGGVATFTIGVQPSGGFSASVDLVAASPSPSLTLALSPTAVVPPGQAMLTVTNKHPATFAPDLWYTVPITATASGIKQTTSVNLLLGGVRVYLPIVLRQRSFTTESFLGPRVQDDGHGAIPFSHFRDFVVQQRPANRACWGFLLEKRPMFVSKWGQIFHMRYPNYRQDERPYEHFSAAERR